MRNKKPTMLVYQRGLGVIEFCKDDNPEFFREVENMQRSGTHTTSEDLDHIISIHNVTMDSAELAMCFDNFMSDEVESEYNEFKAGNRSAEYDDESDFLEFYSDEIIAEMICQLFVEGDTLYTEVYS